MQKHIEQSRLTLPNDISYLPAVLVYVVEVAKKIGFESEDVNHIVLGVEEAVANVIEHAFSPGQRAVFDIICRRIPTGLKVIIKDKGMPFDPESIPTYRPSQLGADSTSIGLGMLLMHEAMDEVSYHNLGRRGKELHLVKYLKTGHIDEMLPAVSKEPAEKPAAKTLRRDIPISIRLMKNGDATGISKCVYRAYGYSYVHEHLYYPNRVAEMNKNGRMTSAVAVTPENEIVGHTAILGPSENSTAIEIGIAVVNQQYRGQGISNRLFDFLIEQAGSKQFKGVYAHAVTNHQYSQKMCEHGAMIPTGLLLGFAPSSLSFKGIHKKLLQRETILLMYRALKQPVRARVYLPARHKAVIRSIYKNIGYKPIFSSKGHADIADEESIIQVTSLRYLGVAFIVIRKYGKHIASEVNARLQHLIRKNIHVVQLFLDLQNPATAVLSEPFEKLGFFFAGILPGEYFENTLILQYLNHISIDYSKIQLHSDSAKELLNYVRGQEKHQ